MANEKAIEAIEALEAEVERLRDALKGLSCKNHDGLCWCDNYGNHPLVPSHTDACKKAREALKED